MPTHAPHIPARPEVIAANSAVDGMMYALWEECDSDSVLLPLCAALCETQYVGLGRPLLL